jgi:hypothetical protein
MAASERGERGEMPPLLASSSAPPRSCYRLGGRVLGEWLGIDSGSGGACGLVRIPERGLVRETTNLFGVLTKLALELLNTTRELLSTGTRTTTTTATTGTRGSGSSSATANSGGDAETRGINISDGTTRRRGRMTKRLVRTTESSQGTKRLETTGTKENLA